MSSRHAAGVSALALGAAAVAVGVISTSDHTDSRLALGVLAVGTSLAFITAGLVARLRRPENRIGGLMVVTGFSWMLGALTTADNATVFTIGMVVGAIAFGFLAHLMLAYPWGRLEERVDRAIIGAVYVLMTVGQLAVVLVSDPGDLGCTRDCPDNRLQAVGDGALSTAVQAAWQVAAIALALAGIARLGTRWRHATPALRRTLAPVYATSALLVAVVAASVVMGQLYG